MMELEINHVPIMIDINNFSTARHRYPRKHDSHLDIDQEEGAYYVV